MGCRPICNITKRSMVFEAVDRVSRTPAGRLDYVRMIDDSDIEDRERWAKVDVDARTADVSYDRFYGDGNYWANDAAASDHRRRVMRRAMKFALSFDKPIHTYWITIPETADPADRKKIDFKIQVTEEEDCIAVHVITPQPEPGRDIADGPLNRKLSSWVFGRPESIASQVTTFNSYHDEIRERQTNLPLTQFAARDCGDDVQVVQVRMFDPSYSVDMDDPERDFGTEDPTGTLPEA